MNNQRLLRGALVMALLGSGAIADAQRPVVMSLEDIFATAETASIQLHPALTAIEEASREIDEARSGRLPDITANLSLSFIGNGFTTRRDFSDYQIAPIPHFGEGLSITVTQPVYTGGAITNSIALAELKSTAARYQADFQRDNIRFMLAGFYLDLYKFHNLRQVMTGNIKAADMVLADMRARHEQGTALLNDITRYELLVSNLELQLVKINNTIDILTHNLTTVAGLPEGTVVEPDSMILNRSLPRNGEGYWQSEAAIHAPSLQLAHNGVEMSRRAERMIKAERLPKIGLQAGWTIDGPILVEVPPINRNLSYWWIGVGMSYNISSLFKTNRSVARSQVTTFRTEQQLYAARENIELGVRADYIHYLEAYEELKTQEKSVELAERNYNTTSTRYNAGMALITDMLDAANSRLDAQQQLINARINIIYYYYKLLFTSGTI
ncbi:MAG: TolC family protein [Odoribacter sp.]|nr:TolC family protein [Odoribacter sp.]